MATRLKKQAHAFVGACFSQQWHWKNEGDEKIEMRKERVEKEKETISAERERERE